MKTVILGNGILALSTAFQVAKKSKQNDEIVIIGKKTRPGSATLAAAAMLNSFAEVEKGALDHEIDFYRFELSHLATRMWPKFILDILEHGSSNLPHGCKNCQGPCGGCFDKGTYIVNNTASDYLDDENYEAIRNALRQFDEPFEEVSPSDIPNYNPEQRYRATRALYIPGEGWINPKLTMEVFDVAVSSFRCVRFVDEEVSTLALGSDGAIANVVLKDGSVEQGDKYLLASGATVTDLLEKSKIDIPIQRVFYGIGVSVELHSPEYPHKKCVRTPNRGLACGLYTVPFFKVPDEPLNSLVVGASNLISPTPSNHPRAVSVQSLLKGAMEQINTNFYRATVTNINVGWRPTSADTYPIVGKTSIANLIVATGTKRDGFHLSPVLSEILCAMILDEKYDERIHCFSPERKLIKTLGRAEAIEHTAKHMMSAAYQHGFIPPHSRMKDQMLQSYKDDLERLHDKVGAKDWGIPPEMVDMYRYGHLCK